jgi:hypothetical protein
VNVGSRQFARERSGNVIDAPVVRREPIAEAIARALSAGRRQWRNVYGDGHASEKIVSLLRTHPLDRSLLDKTNAY